MKKQINDLLLKMHKGEYSIDLTSNKLFDLYNTGITKGVFTPWTNDDIDIAYAVGCLNIGGIDALNEELKRLKKIGFKPHQVISKIRHKKIN